MNKIIPVFLFITQIYKGLAAQKQELSAKSSIEFSINSFASLHRVKGQFKEAQIWLDWNSSQVEENSLIAEVSVKSIDTDNSTRDNNLMEAEYFDAKEYPSIHFESKAIEVQSEGLLNVTGTLQIIENQHTINFPMHYEIQGKVVLFS